MNLKRSHKRTRLSVLPFLYFSQSSTSTTFIVRSSSNFSRDSLKSSKLVTSESHQIPVEFWWQFHRIIPSINLIVFSMTQWHWIQWNSNKIPIRFFYGLCFIFVTCNAIKMQWHSHYIFLVFDGPKILNFVYFCDVKCHDIPIGTHRILLSGTSSFPLPFSLSQRIESLL